MGMPRILAVGTANPPSRFTQEEALALAGYTDARRRGFFLNSGIDGRYLAIEKSGFRPTESLDDLSARFRKASVDLGCRALLSALAAPVASLATWTSWPPRPAPDASAPAWMRS